ncbi:MAG TPA: DUF4236 domain-containing protein [Thermoanaerobaculia bacterium]|nr:DUF4236 domain-containing protein [Thermoanaerobaculia bacterium]
MPFYLRKSVSVGPIRFNLSGSGVGVSAGVAGFRVGTGPRGNYVHVGRRGVYYRHTFSADPIPHDAPRREIDSGAADAIVDSSSEQLLDELRSKKRKMALRPLAITLAITLFVLAMLSGSGWAMLLMAVAGLMFILAAARRDRIAKTAVIHYDFDPQVEQAFRRFNEWANTLATAVRTWHIAATESVRDRKYHAGAGNLVQRHPTAVRTAEPPFLKTNVPVLSIGVGRQTLYFLPDRLLVYDAAGIGAISYRTLEISAANKRFIEEDGLPRDATVVDHTWRYVNKNGGPDRRFSNNRQIPICLYDELTLRTPTGLNEVIQISRAGVGEGFVAAVRHLASVTS